MAKGRNLLWQQAMSYLAMALLCILPAWSCGKKAVKPQAKDSNIVTNSIGMKLILIPPGEFMMGSPDSEKYRQSDEGPQHRVRISKGFYMSVTEVTQAQWQAVMGSNPSLFKGFLGLDKNDDLPVECVSWNDAVEFCRKLSQKEGKSYRLPTEAEWEYACRAGTTTRFYFGDSDSQLSDYAWCDEDSGNKTYPVGQKKPNAFGLYDMHGNVWEWCSDWYDENYYSESPADDPKGPSTGQYLVLRGGSWSNLASSCRVANRDYSGPNLHTNYIGFRLVQDF
jgi:formylglycine-generating enzyme required for sulfatase activity